jgi:Chondroitinase B
MPLKRRNFLFGIASLPASSLLAGRALPGLTATVYNGYELHTALQAAGAGSTILLAPGNFGDIGSFVLAGSDISVRVQAPLRTTLRSRMVVNGSFVDLDGLAFEEGIELIGTGVSISNNRFNGNGVRVSGVNAVVANNEIGPYRDKAIIIHGSATGATVRGNYIHDAMGGSSDGFAAVQVGESMNDSERLIRARVENNRIVRCDAGSEAISVKSSGNMFIGNTLSDSRANITNRHGHNNVYQNNVLERSYCIVVHDRGTRLIGNRAVNPLLARSFRIIGGNISHSSNHQGGHPQAYDTYLQGNVGALEIGAQFPGNRLPAVNTTVVSHSGPISLRAAVGTRLPGGADVDRDNGGGNGRGNGGGNGRGGRGRDDDDDRNGRGGRRRRRRRNRRGRGNGGRTASA